MDGTSGNISGARCTSSTKDSESSMEVADRKSGAAAARGSWSTVKRQCELRGVRSQECVSRKEEISGQVTNWTAGRGEDELPH